MVLEQDISKFYDYFIHENPSEIRVFDKKKYPLGKSIFIKDKVEFIELVKKYQKEGVDVYYGFRDRKGKGDENVVFSDNIFFEIDEHDIKKPEQLQKVEVFLKKNGIKAGIKGFSGGGYHFYIPHKKKYFFTPEDRVFYKKILTAFKDALLDAGIDVDTAVFNLERLGRIIGTQNFKRGKQSKILEYNTNIDLEQNQAAIRHLIVQYDKKELEIDKNALELLKIYKIDKTDKWLYDIICKKCVIKEDSGANSIVFKNAAILLAREGLVNEEMKIIGKALADLCEGRTLASFMGWVKKTQNNQLAEVNEIEIKNFIVDGGYPLEDYSQVEEKDKKKNSNNLRFLTFKDYLKLRKDHNYLVDKFLYPKSVNMIYSPPASFKSLIALDMAMSISKGKDFLNFKTKKNPVLYCDGENSDLIVKDRLEKFYKGKNFKRKGFPLYILKNGILIDSKKNVNSKFILLLEEFIKEKKIKLIIFDTMHRFAFYDENRADDINLLYTSVFKPLIEEYGVTIVFLHHSRKDGGYRGSGDFLGMVDVCYKVIRIGKNKFKIINEKSRSGEIETISGEIDFAEDYFKMIRLSGEKESEDKLSLLKETTNKIKGMFKEGTLLKRKDILDDFELSDFNYGSLKTVQRSLKWLVDNNYLDKTEKGVYSLILR